MSQPPSGRRLGPINLPPPPPPAATPPPSLNQQPSARPLTSRQLGMTVIPKRSQKPTYSSGLSGSLSNLYQIPPNAITSAPATPLAPIVPISSRLPSPPRILSSRPNLISLPINLPTPDLMYDKYTNSPIVISSIPDQPQGYVTTRSNLYMLGDPVAMFEYFRQFNSVDEFLLNLPNRPYPQLVEDHSIFLFNNFKSSPSLNIHTQRERAGFDQQITLSSGAT